MGIQTAQRITRQFRSDVRGVVAVEFAMIGMLIIELILETMQGGLTLYQQGEIERVTALASRQVLVGTSGSGSMTAAQFAQQVICPTLSKAMTCSNVVVDSQTVSEAAQPGGFYTFVKSDLSNLVAPPTNQGSASFCTGASGAVVYMRVTYLAPAISPAFRAYASATGSTVNGVLVHPVTAYAAFRNEPFPGGVGC